MILVTGGTGFIGSELVDYLLKSREQVRILLHPSPNSPNLPRGIAFETAVCSLDDERGLRAAMQGIQWVFHLASAEHQATHDLAAVDVEGTKAVVFAAVQANVKRFMYLSHIGADKNSLFPVQKAKALAEESIILSGLNYTIFRSSIIFGKNDHFTTQIERALHNSIVFFPLPGSGEVTLQPLWISDLITCMLLAMRNERTFNKRLEIGGGEFLTFRAITKLIMTKIKKNRLLIPLSPAYLRTANLWLGRLTRKFPYSNAWLDYLAADHTCALDTLPKLFGLLPARFAYHLDYL